MRYILTVAWLAAVIAAAAAGAGEVFAAAVAVDAIAPVGSVAGVVAVRTSGARFSLQAPLVVPTPTTSFSPTDLLAAAPSWSWAAVSLGPASVLVTMVAASPGFSSALAPVCRDASLGLSVTAMSCVLGTDASASTVAVGFSTTGASTSPFALPAVGSSWTCAATAAGFVGSASACGSSASAQTGKRPIAAAKVAEAIFCVIRRESIACTFILKARSGLVRVIL